MWEVCTKKSAEDFKWGPTWFFFLILALNHSNCAFQNTLFHGNLFKIICVRKQPVSRVWNIFGDLLLEIKEASVFFHHENRQQIIMRHPTYCKQKFSTHSKLEFSVALLLELCGRDWHQGHLQCSWWCWSSWILFPRHCFPTDFPRLPLLFLSWKGPVFFSPTWAPPGEV